MYSQTETTRSRIAKRMAEAIQSETDDRGNPNLMLQTIDTDLVIAIATGVLDAVKLARRELANRGLDETGRWIGFDAAARAWEVK
jgi:hypothetical protein